jgi:hypothetical protein
MAPAKTIMAAAVASIKAIAGKTPSSIREVGGVPVETFTNASSIDLTYGVFAVADHLTLATHSDFDFDYTDAFSLSVWFKSTRTSWQGMIEKVSAWGGSWGAIRGWGIDWYGGVPQFWMNNAYTSNGVQAKPTSGTWNDGNWHHVVCTTAGTAGTLTNSDMGIWIDGVSQTLGYHNGNSLSAAITGTYPIRIGQVFGGYGANWDGGLDEMSVWDKALSSAEIAAIYNSGAPANLANHSAASNLVSWWRMGDGDDGAGTSDSSDSGDASARIYDMSANSHHMTPVVLASGDIVSDVP